MASVNTVKIGSTSYSISPSKNGTLTGYTSNDAASPSSWTAANAITATETQSSIFSKLTTMIKNARWIYTKFGTTDFSATGATTISAAIVAINSGLSSKADATHSHTVSDLPVSSSQVNSTTSVPTSSVTYSMQTIIDSMQTMADELLAKLG